MAFKWRFLSGWYEPWNSGLRSLGESSAMGQAMLGQARKLASAADRGYSKYDAAPYTVRSGRRNEPRAGAIAFESERDWRDVRDERLKNTARAMGRRQ